MFNVSALLLDDALKPATPLTNGAINETLIFHKVILYHVYLTSVNLSEFQRIRLQKITAVVGETD